MKTRDLIVLVPLMLTLLTSCAQSPVKPSGPDDNSRGPASASDKQGVLNSENVCFWRERDYSKSYACRVPVLGKGVSIATFEWSESNEWKQQPDLWFPSHVTCKQFICDSIKKDGSSSDGLPLIRFDLAANCDHLPLQHWAGKQAPNHGSYKNLGQVTKDDCKQ